MNQLSPKAKEALNLCFATRGRNKGQLLARCPKSGTLAAAAWQGAMMSCNPYLVSIGALLFMSEEQRAIQTEVMAFFDSLPHATRIAAERIARLLKHWESGNMTQTLKSATDIAGIFGFPSKMPGTSYGISAESCHTGSKLAKIPGSVCYGCYALKGNYIYPSVKSAHAKRESGLDSPHWVAAMVALISHAQRKGTNRLGDKIALGFHRWHDSGDLQSVDHLRKICEVAKQTPRIKHWLPTRELGFVKAYLDQGGTVPKNLVVRVSATMIDGNPTKAWPNTSTVHDKKRAIGRTCPAPTQDNACGDCRACWNPRVKNVSYHKH